MALGNRSTAGVRLTLPTGVEVASYANYLDAQRAVDHLSDHKLPVEEVTIVGTDLRMVEKIIGRLTYGRVAGGGAMSGAWFGLLIGLVLWMLSPNQSYIVLAALAMGAAFGIMFAVVQFALRSRDRDFASTSQVVASRYAIVAAQGVAAQVRRELESAGLGGRAAGGPTGGAGGPTGGAGGHGPAGVGPQRRAPYGGGPAPQPHDGPAESAEAGPGTTAPGTTGTAQGRAAAGGPFDPYATGPRTDATPGGRHAGWPAAPGTPGPQAPGGSSAVDEQGPARPWASAGGAAGESGATPDGVPDGAPDGAPDEDSPSAFGSRADERPRYGIRLAPGQSVEDVLGRQGGAQGGSQSDSQDEAREEPPGGAQDQRDGGVRP